METLADLGETELLQRLEYYAPPGQFSDDTALINTGATGLLVSSDVLVEGIHFSNCTVPPCDLGWRAVAANVSDLICSGADSVIGVTVTLVAPPSTPWSWVASVYEGLQQALKVCSAELLGGDCSAGKERLLAITALGKAGLLHLHRGRARPGDMLVTAGPHGLSRLGLALLRSEVLPQGVKIPANLRCEAIRAHRRPSINLDLVQSLLVTHPPGLPWRLAGTDSSDGLLKAVRNICHSSRCQAVLNRSCLPRASGWPTGGIWDHWCLEGGEDFEPVLSLPPSWAEAWLCDVPDAVCIGSMQTGPATAIWTNGEELADTLSFHHFQ